MKTTIYLIRHSKVYKNYDINYSNDNMQIENEKLVLSPEGEERAKKLSQKQELQNINAIFSSHYTRAIGTAKYIAENNNITLQIDSRFGERKFGINSWDELPKDYFYKQSNDENYKINNGENRKEVTTRMYEGLKEVLETYKGKTCTIISHGTAISFLLMKLCQSMNVYDDNNNITKKFIFKDKEIFKGLFEAPELFKLEFDEKNNLLDIENIKFDLEI